MNIEGVKKSVVDSLQGNNTEVMPLLITHVSPIGPYLQISGQISPDAMSAVHNNMQEVLQNCISTKANKDHQQSLLKIGKSVIYKFVRGAAPEDYELIRSRIVNVLPNDDNIKVEIELIDYGYTKLVPSEELLFPQDYDILHKIPAIGVKYILLGICKDWQKNEIEEIEQMIYQKMVNIRIEIEFNQIKFITMKWKEFNFSEYLIHQKKIGAPIANNLLCENITKYIKEQNMQPKTSVNTTNNNYLPMVKNESNTNRNIYNNDDFMVYNKVKPKKLENINITQLAPSFDNDSLQYRLRRYQQPQSMMDNRFTNLMRLNMPHTIGNFQPMMQASPLQTVQDPHHQPQLNNYRNMKVNKMHNEIQYNSSFQNYRGHHYVQQQRDTHVDCKQEEENPSDTQHKIAAFRTAHLPSRKTYEVYISFVENGPCLFSVQLASTQEELTQMMNRIEKIEFKQITYPPVVGMACIARYSEDGQLYRALITNVQKLTCKVSYIDYGNSEVVNMTDLYEITEEFLTPKAFAMRFTLYGIKELDPIDDSLKKTFKELVMYQNCRLKVTPLDGPPLVQYCELYLHGQNTLDLLKQVQICRLVYPKFECLQNNDIVEIRYTDSPKCFFVQKLSNNSAFQKLMDDMYLYYNKNQVVPINLKLGGPCMVKNNNEWYRAEILRADSITITVRFVDYGNEKNITKNLISTIAEEHLCMPRQAVQCCLKGFENNELNMDLATSQMEMLAEESNNQRRRFSTKVFRIQPDGTHVINLYTKDLNLMKKLYKLSMPFEQYLSLEKDDFNLHSDHHSPRLPNDTNIHKASSIVSSNELVSINSSKKSISNQAAQKKLSNNPKQLQDARQLKNLNKEIKKDDDKNNANKSNQNDNSITIVSESEKIQQRPGRNTQQKENKANSSNNSLADSDSMSADSKTRNINGNSWQSREINSKHDNRRSHNKHRPQNAPQGYTNHKLQKAGVINKTGDNSSTSTSSINTENEEVLEQFVNLDNEFPIQHIEVPCRETTEMSWWVSPYQFFIQLKSKVSEFESLMNEMQTFYKKQTWQPLQLKVGSNVIVRYRKDNVFYRARILACNQMLRKYKIFLVDIGSQNMIAAEDIWQVEKRFSSLPCMAYRCTHRGIVMNYDHLYLIDRMDKYLTHGSKLICEFNNRIGSIYEVNIIINQKYLKDELERDGIISNVCPELRLDLLAGQQIYAKFIYIKDMLNFKIEIEGFRKPLQLISSYDDIRFVKSNRDVKQNFKEFYEKKLCVINIKDVNENKVVLLRPLLPLLKEEKLHYICNSPIFVETFDIRVVHISSVNRIFGHFVHKEKDFTQLQNDMNAFYEANDMPMKSFDPELICAVKSHNSNWYRGRIIKMCSNNSNLIEIYLIDYGNSEKIHIKNIKQLIEKYFVNKSSFGIAVNLPLKILTDGHGHGHEKGKLKKFSDTNSELDSLAIKELNEQILNKIVKVNVLEFHENHLIGEILLKNKKTVVDILKEKHLAKRLNNDEFRNILSKKKSNKIIYIETVDLTLEEDDFEKKNTMKDNKKKIKIDTKAIKENIPNNIVNTIDKNENEISKNISINLAENNQREEFKNIEITELTTDNIHNGISDKKKTNSQQNLHNCTNMEYGILSHCDNPAQFFVHRQEKLEELRNLQENLQIVASSLPPLMRVINGAHCISLYSVDKQWYRAKIIDAELMVLQFIDYGNTDCVSDTSDIKEMSVFPNIEPLCIPCSLPIKPNGTVDWVDAANAIFNDSYSKVLHFEYLTRGDIEKSRYINLFIEGVNIAEKLIEDGYAKPLQLVDSGENCYISHANSIMDFYIQYENNSKALELIEMYLSEYTKLKKISVFQPFKIVAALFPDDEMWYRAKLLKEIPNKGYEVFFIDYGNKSISPECREISDEIAKLPPLSQKCALHLPDDCVSWSYEAEMKFSEIVAAGETIFNVELQKPAIEYALVHLFIDGHNINDDLEILCKHKQPEFDLNDSIGYKGIVAPVYEMGIMYDVTISHVNSPNDFYVKLNKDLIRLDDITNRLNSLGMDELIDPKINKLCAAIHPTENIYCRARVLEIISEEKKEYRVLFIDFGNETITTKLRMLPPDLVELKEFSKHCQLGICHSNINEITTTFIKEINTCDGHITIEFVNNTVEPNIIQIYNANTQENIGNRLQRLIEERISIGDLDQNKCLISHVISPSEFYIQPKKNCTKLDFVIKRLEKSAIENIPKCLNVKIGDICCAYSNEDDCYYRGRIENINTDGSSFDVFLMDNGNTITTKDIRELSDELKSMESLALRCKLNNIPDSSNEGMDQIFSTLIESHFGEIFEIESIKSDPVNDIHIVKLQVNFKDLSEELFLAIKSNDKEDLISPLPKLFDCSIIYVNSPSSFYIQLTADIPAVQTITNILSNAESDFKEFNDLKVGAICAAQFKEDLVYYRAEIVKVLENGNCEVHYLDFGNNSITNEFRALPEDLLNEKKIYSKHCALDNKNLSTSEVCTQFSNFIDARFSETFKVEFLKTTSNPQIVRLFYQNENVANQINKTL